ncbi:unnamed protein product, partial [Rotaria sp. Silwood2]
DYMYYKQKKEHTETNEDIVAYARQQPIDDQLNIEQSLLSNVNEENNSQEYLSNKKYDLC